MPIHRGDLHESGVGLVYKFFSSNTSRKSYWLPQASVFHRFNQLFNADRLNLKLTASYNRFNSELPVSRSLAPVALLPLDPAAVPQYTPVAEAAGYTGLQPVEHREVQAGFELNLNNKFTFIGTWFNRQIRKYVFPFLQNNTIRLANMAGHYNRGIELQAEYNYYNNSKACLLYTSRCV